MDLRWTWALIAMLAGVEADAQLNEWHDPCLKLEPGFSLLGEMPKRPARVDAHIRVHQPAPRSQANVTLAWNAQDSLNYSYARMRLTGHSDDIYLSKTIVTTGRVADGIDIPAEDFAFDPSPGYESLRLIYDGFSARICTKDGSIPVRYDTDGPTAIFLATDSPIQCQRLTALGQASTEIKPCGMQSADSLFMAIVSSVDKAEGLWEYMDQDIREGKASLGGQYRLATIKNVDGGYDIVYIDGAKENASAWKPLSVKGRLSPTIFIGNFDMQWIDANGLMLQRECNAQLDPNGAILTLRFPLQNSQIRLRRIPL